jgi:AraC-like DNA-binding protein
LLEAEGSTVTEFVLSRRVEHARRMLRSSRFSKHSISAIAFEVGFNSSSYFTRCFKEEYNKTPSEYLQES